MIDGNFSVNNSNLSKHKSKVGIVLLLPVFALILMLVIIPLARILTGIGYAYNPRSELFIKVFIRNFHNLFKHDKYIYSNINYTVFVTLFSVPVSVGISLFMAWISAGLNKKCKYILCVLFLIASTTSIAPIGMDLLFTERIFRNLFRTYFDCRWYSILISFLLGVGPLYFIFTVCFIVRDKLVRYLHIALSVQIVMCFLSYIPMVEYIKGVFLGTLDLSERIFNDITPRGGGDNTILIVAGVTLTILFVYLNGVVWSLNLGLKLLRRDLNKIKPDQMINHRSSFKNYFIFIMIFVFALELMTPFIMTIYDSVKGINLPNIDYYQSFLYKYKDLLLNAKYLHLQNCLINSVVAIVVSIIAIFVVLFVSCIGLALLKSKRKSKGMLLAIFICLISSTILIYTKQNNDVMTLFNISISSLEIALKGTLFGISLFVGVKLVDVLFNKDQGLRKSLANKKVVCGYTFGIIALAAISSLTMWYQQDYLPRVIYDVMPQYYNGLLIYQLYLRDYNNSALLVLSMVIPILVISVFVPVVLSSFCNSKEIKSNHSV